MKRVTDTTKQRAGIDSPVLRERKEISLEKLSRILAEELKKTNDRDL